MGVEQFSAQAVRTQLENVLSSAGFGRNERLSRFLRFVVERHLDGKDSELKESLIAIEVFGRKPDYDPKLDSIVRTEAARLRARLAEYYAVEGRGDPILIELPKGHYVPVISQPERTPETSAPGETTSGLGAGSQRRTRLWVAVGLAIALTVAVTIGSVLSRRAAPATIAVLPLENLGHDPANDYFVDGLTAEIIRNLSVIDGLQVRSQTSSFAFRGKPRDLREAGKQLEADFIVEGSVLRVGQRLRIDAQLVRVRGDSPLWSGRFDRELTDIFAIQDEISRGIVNSLRLKLNLVRRHYETNTGAYDLYLHARALAARQVASFFLASERAELFKQVIAKDPSFAPAYAGLAAAYASRWVDLGLEAPDTDSVQEMHAAADKAIELDPLLAEAHEALGSVFIAERQWDQAEKRFRRAIELDPSSYETYGFAALLLMTLGRIEEAIRQARAGVKADPLSPRAHGVLTFVLLSASRYDEAADHALKMDDLDLVKHQFLARARLGQGRIDDGIRLLENDKANPNLGFLGYAYARSGRTAEAERIAAEYTRPNIQVLTYAGLGDRDRTLEALDRMAARSVSRVGQYLTYPELSLLRGDPRLKSFRKKIGLPE